MESLEALRRATAEFDRRLSSVTDGQWDAPTPCDDWTVRQLVSHVVGGNAMAVELLGGASSEQALPFLGGLPLGDDPLATFRAGAEAQLAAFASPGALERTCHHPMGDLPGAEVAGFRVGDLTLHSWDLARAIGADEDLDAELVAAVYARLEPMAPMLDQVGVFGEGPSGAVGADAPLQRRLLDLAGRRP
ncbi:MAG: TIGR03086 family metal-binding protein [Acidimicrobiales bacterium]|jgi:uncharacterized protein (TIGR03086 family)|nr:TIGR03086 family metal-binding protein [Acidimicrobiales bacterium]